MNSHGSRLTVSLLYDGTVKPAKGGIVSPFQGLGSFDSSTQGGARFTSLALGYHLSGFQPFQVEPPHVGWLHLNGLWRQEQERNQVRAFARQ